MILTLATLPPIVCEGPDLTGVSGWEMAQGGESPVLTVGLDPRRLDLRALLDPPPLRVAATLSDGTTVLFAGLVQRVRLGADPLLVIEG